MLATIGIILVAAAIIAIEVPGLRKKKQHRELWVFSILLFLGVGLSIAESWDINVPSPLAGIEAVFKPISNVLFK